MKELSIKLAPFILKQTIFIREMQEIRTDVVTSIEVPQREIASYISLQTDVERVHLFGNQKLARKIQEDCLSKYKVKNIDFVFNK